MKITRLLVIRHGQSEWNAIGRWQGHADPSLSDLGRRQAIEAAGAICAVDGIFSSDLLRASETAALISAHTGIGPVVVDERLRERDAGEWTGLTKVEIDQQWPGWVAQGRRPDGFESATSVVARLRAAFAALHATHAGASLLVIAHGGVIRALEKAHGIAGEPIENLGGVSIDVSAAGEMIGERLALLNGDTVAITHNDQL